MLIKCDGGSRGNPGPAAIGAVLYDSNNTVITTISQAIGRTTNNQAEYRAVIAALEEAVRLGARQVDLRIDSELIVRQLSGQYRVKKEELKPLSGGKLAALVLGVDTLLAATHAGLCPANFKLFKDFFH